MESKACKSRNSVTDFCWVFSRTILSVCIEINGSLIGFLWKVMQFCWHIACFSLDNDFKEVIFKNRVNMLKNGLESRKFRVNMLYNGVTFLLNAYFPFPTKINDRK